MFKKTVASKEQVKLMIGLTGPSGSGKTFSALQLAYGITKDWTKIAVADTENRSSLFYAGEKTGSWEHIDFSPTLPGGYHPANWVNLISFVEKDPNIEVLVLDSISHEWQGIGGCLQLVEVFAKAAKGNTFTPWKQVTPLHDSFIDKMRSSRLHIIATMRVSTEYSLEKNESTGKTTPKKIGMKPTQREGMDYEFGVIFDIDINHYSVSSKDRTGLFMEKPPFLINSELGETLVKWTKDGVEAPVVSTDPASRTTRVCVSFAVFGIGPKLLEDYLRKSCAMWEDADFAEVHRLYLDFKEKKIDKDALIDKIALRDL